jgi:hypothetical protein
MEFGAIGDPAPVKVRAHQEIRMVNHVGIAGRKPEPAPVLVPGAAGEVARTMVHVHQEIRIPSRVGIAGRKPEPAPVLVPGAAGEAAQAKARVHQALMIHSPAPMAAVRSIVLVHRLAVGVHGEVVRAQPKISISTMIG